MERVELELVEWAKRSTNGILTVSDNAYTIKGQSYRDSAYMESVDSFPLDSASDTGGGTTVFVEWQSVGSQYRNMYVRLYYEDKSFILHDPRFTANHSYAGSVVVPSNTRLFTSVVISGGSMTCSTCSGNYLHLGGSLILSYTASISIYADCQVGLDLSDNYDGGNGGITVHKTTVSYLDNDGDFVPIDEVPNGIIFPSDALVSTTVGTGLLNSNGSTVYIKGNNNIIRGEVLHLITEDLSTNTQLTFAEDGALTLIERGETKTGSSELNQLGFKQQNGQLILFDDDSVPVFNSKYFDYIGAFLSYPLADGNTMDSYRYSFFPTGSLDFLIPVNQRAYLAVWANKETRAQANPYPDNMQLLADSEDIRLSSKFNVQYSSPYDQSGELRPIGYIESTVTLSGVPQANKTVKLFTQSGIFIDQTASASDGTYRFDHLLMSERYFVVAFYNENYSDQPDYLATAADFLNPTAY